MRCSVLWLFVVIMGCMSALEADPAGPEDDAEIETEWVEDEEGGCPDSWLLTYSLQGRVDITDTPLNIGNADAQVGGLDTDELVIHATWKVAFRVALLFGDWQ